MKNKTIDYTEYSENASKLAKEIFGEVMFNKMNTTSYKAFKWDGLDVTTHHLTATCLNIKKRFSQSYISKYKKEGTTALEMFIRAVFHYGYQQCVDVELEDYKKIGEMQKLSFAFEKIDNDKLKEEKESLEQRVLELEAKLKAKS